MKRTTKLQSKLFSFSDKYCFGGEQLRGKRKTARPIACKTPLHLVMRSSQARGEKSFLKHKRKIENLLNTQAQNWGVKIYAFANVGNHMHIVLRARTRRAYKGFIRSISGLIARIILKKERGKALATMPSASLEKLSSENFWDARPFTRILKGGLRDLHNTCAYIGLNKLEALGFDRKSIENTKSSINGLKEFLLHSSQNTLISSSSSA
jgi:REP element-mobilizing transposase RayT